MGKRADFNRETNLYVKVLFFSTQSSNFAVLVSRGTVWFCVMCTNFGDIFVNIPSCAVP